MKNLRVSKFRIGVYLVFFIVCLISILFFSFYKNQTVQTRGKAEENTMVNTTDVVPFSETDFQKNSTNVDLYVDPQKTQKPLYKTEETGAAAVLEFMKENPAVVPVSPESQSVKGVSTPTNPRKMLPPHFDQNSRLIRQMSDKKLPARLRGKAMRDHFYYNQQIGGIPIYGSMVRFDVQNNNEIVGVEGSLLTNQTVTRGSITQDEATATALKKASSDASKSTPLGVCFDKIIEKAIVNKNMLGLSDDEQNFETFKVPVCNSNSLIFFDKTYYIDTKTGSIQLERNNIFTALNRVVNSCASGSCIRARTEGSTSSSDADVDNSYDILGEVYNYYFNNYQRDSFDGQGATIQANVHYPFKSPNAQWTGRDMRAGSGMIARDVWGHELTHAVTEYTAGLPGDHQGGSLNESISDIAGYALDPGNWTMGETTVLGTIRDISDPARISRDGLGPQPDRLFASGYYCGNLDDYGTHHNNGVLNKAFYLMTVGGTFNGCTITGITKEKSLAVIYKAQTTYLQPNSNFKDMYDAVLKACADLYTSLDSSECQSVKAAFQATEMDQQPAGTQTGAKCQNAQLKTPGCVGAAPQPTSGVTPTVPVTPTATESATPTIEPAGVTPTLSLSQPTPTPESVVLDVALKFQGVNQKPIRLTSIPVKITVVNESQDIFVEKTVTVTSDDSGIWHGSVGIGVSAGDGYTVLVKGPMHIQKKIGHLKPTEVLAGAYRRENATFSLQTGTNTLDFSGILQLVGDLPEQDGVVNSYDISLVRNNLGVTDSTVAFCDVNYDGVCNTQDYSLLIAALSVRVDEE